MGRYTGPRTKISRRFGEPVFGPDKVLERRPNPPGQYAHDVDVHKVTLMACGMDLNTETKGDAQ